MPDDKQIAQKDAVETDVGLVHVMPKAYQGGKLPEGSKTVEPKSPVKHEVTLTPAKKPVAPPPVKKVPPKPLPPKKNPHKNRILLIVGGVVALVLVAIVAVLLLTSRSPDEPPAAPVVTVPETPIVSVPPEPAEPSVPDEPATPPEPFVKEPTSGRDTDSDGLSDVEERLYGSNVRLPDTDRDGFLDGNEVFHRYDPLTPDPATLLERGVVKSYAGGNDLIQFLYPSLWQSESAFEPPSSLDISIEAPSGERILVTTSRMHEGSTLRAELERMAQAEDDAEILNVEYSTSKAGYELAMQKDQMRATLNVDGLLVLARYELGEKNTIDFIQTFQMIVGSVTPFVLEDGL